MADPHGDDVEGDQLSAVEREIFDAVFAAECGAEVSAQHGQQAAATRSFSGRDAYDFLAELQRDPGIKPTQAPASNIDSLRCGRTPENSGWFRVDLLRPMRRNADPSCSHTLQGICLVLPRPTKHGRTSRHRQQAPTRARAWSIPSWRF